MSQIAPPVNSDTVLAMLVASYQQQQSEPSTPVKAKPSKLATIKLAQRAALEVAQGAQPCTVGAAGTFGSEPAPVTPRQPVSMVELPPVGTYDARTFFAALRRAKGRDQEIQAIAGYCGFDRYGDFGSQLLTATMQARRQCNPCTALAQPVHTAAPAVAGYVTGIPDELGKRVQDLLARERLAAETMGEQDKIAADESKSVSERAIAHGLAQVERERLQQIRVDLQQMGYTA